MHFIRTDEFIIKIHIKMVAAHILINLTDEFVTNSKKTNTAEINSNVLGKRMIQKFKYKNNICMIKIL